MPTSVNPSDKAVILLHEIYGVNDFIKLTADRYARMGFQVFIHDMLHGQSFSYDQADEAYQYFNQNIGFDAYKNVEVLIKNLKKKFRVVILAGFSVGATVAWRCCRNLLCDGIICHYGSRIRDYSEMTPTCPVLAVFAEQDSFDVHILAKSIDRSPMVHILRIDGPHGFMDPYSSAYDNRLTEEVYYWIENNLRKFF